MQQNNMFSIYKTDIRLTKEYYVYQYCHHTCPKLAQKLGKFIIIKIADLAFPKLSLFTMINNKQFPKVILRHMMMNFLDFNTIKKIILIIPEKNILDDHSKKILEKIGNY